MEWQRLLLQDGEHRRSRQQAGLNLPVDGDLPVLELLQAGDPQQALDRIAALVLLGVAVQVLQLAGEVQVNKQMVGMYSYRLSR